jgi:hypothetical protein
VRTDPKFQISCIEIVGVGEDLKMTRQAAIYKATYRVAYGVEGRLKSFATSSFQKLAGLFDFCRETFLIRKSEAQKGPIKKEEL